jgi:hypothetical protein
VAKKVLKIVEVSDECKEYYLNDHLIMRANHDDHGWSGMEDIDKIARAMAEGCGARIDEQHADTDADTEDHHGAIVKLLYSFLSNANAEQVSHAAKLLADDGVTVNVIKEHISVVETLCKKHNLQPNYELTVADTPSVFVGVSITVLACSSMDMTFQLNSELAMMEEEHAITRHTPIFDIVFSRKH